jgi:hypothetical protein
MYNFYVKKLTFPNSSSRDTFSPGDIVLGVEVPLQGLLISTSHGRVIESGKHSFRNMPWISQP